MEEPTAVREQVLAFTRACEALAGFVHQNNGLTTLEREFVLHFVRALDLEAGPFAPTASPDDPPMAATLSNLPPID